MTELFFEPKVIAHRGASGYAPENTMAAFTKAAQLGMKWVEFDVMLAASGELIVFHDETLDRTTNGKGDITPQVYHYLRSLDAGKWFSPQFSGECIPLLQQVLNFLQQYHMFANVEIKPLPNQDEMTAIKSLELISTQFPEFRSSILFSSFSIDSLRTLRRYSPDCMLGLLLHEWEPGWEEICENLNCVSVHVNEEIMTREMAEKIKKMGKKILCYTVNNPVRAKLLYSWGVDAVFSDFPDKISQIIQ